MTLLSKKDSYSEQKDQDINAIVDVIFETLTAILPPPSHKEIDLKQTLFAVVSFAVNLSVEMRTQRAEYIMLPPLQPEYDANGDLTSKVQFNAALMNCHGHSAISNVQLEESGALVRYILFPLVVKKYDDTSSSDKEVVIYPAQVVVKHKGQDLATSLSEISLALG